MDTYDFARGLARVLDRNSEMGLRQIVEKQRRQLQRISDPNRPFKTLMHIIIDTVQPEYVPRLMPKGLVTVRVAARILTNMASQSRVTPLGAPVILDRDMYLFVFKTIFQYFLRLLTLDVYDEQPGENVSEEDPCSPMVDFSSDGVTFNQAAHRRWTAVIGQPTHFQVVADFLRTVSPDQYGLWYFRAMKAVVSLDRTPDEDELREILGRMRRPHLVN